MGLFRHALVMVRGGGDLASGVIFRLHRAGFPVIVTELPKPLLVRRMVSYGEVVFSDTIMVEGIRASLVSDLDQAQMLLDKEEIPVLIDPIGTALNQIAPMIVVDGRMEKRNIDTTIHDAKLVIALGPGFTAGLDCHAVIETNRGHHLGRVITKGSAEADTGEPGTVSGKSHSRVIRAPATGKIRPNAEIGDMIKAGQVIAVVDNEDIIAPFDGILRGLIHEDVLVQPGMKIGDLDPRARRVHCFQISDKALAVGGGVVEAVLSAPQLHPYLQANHETPSSV